MSLTVICICETPTEDTNEKESRYSGFFYDFDVEDILLGEGSDVSMVELRPCLVTEFSGLDSFALLSSRNIPQSASLASQGISNEESMKEYSDLKFSLLLYDTMLIFVRTQLLEAFCICCYYKGLLMNYRLHQKEIPIRGKGYLDNIRVHCRVWH